MTRRGLFRRPVTFGVKGNTEFQSGDSVVTPLPSPIVAMGLEDAETLDKRNSGVTAKAYSSRS